MGSEQSENMQTSGPYTPNPQPFEPNINRLRQTVED